MRKLLLRAALLATGCGQEEGARQNESGAAAPAAGTPVQTATLTGLYESTSTPPSQLCITEQGRAARFGLVIRRNGRPGCSGAGTAGPRSCALSSTLARTGSDGKTRRFPLSMTTREDVASAC